MSQRIHAVDGKCMLELLNNLWYLFGETPACFVLLSHPLLPKPSEAGILVPFHLLDGEAEISVQGLFQPSVGHKGGLGILTKMAEPWPTHNQRNP